jgi:hypothetical protein
MTDLVRHDEEERHGAIQLLLSLEAEGKADEVSLTLTDPDMKIEAWEALGRFLGSIDRRARWYIGDWLIFGESVYGEDAAQGVESTTRERYDEAARTTGLDHGTLMNIRSVCAKVARSRRRKELGFWIHAEVSPLEPEEQSQWLQKAIDSGWTRNELRDAIREAKGGLPEPGPEPPPGPGAMLTIGERIEHAARLIHQQAQPTPDGAYLVPAEPMMQLREALGEES